MLANFFGRLVLTTIVAYHTLINFVCTANAVGVQFEPHPLRLLMESLTALFILTRPPPSINIPFKS